MKGFEECTITMYVRVFIILNEATNDLSLNIKVMTSHLKAVHKETNSVTIANLSAQPTSGDNDVCYQVS